MMKPSSTQPNSGNKKGNPKNNNAVSKKTLINNSTPAINAAPAVKNTLAIKSSPAVKRIPKKGSKNATIPLSTPKVIDLSTEDSECEIQKVVTLSGKETKRRQGLTATDVAESPIRHKRIKIEIAPVKYTKHTEVPRTPTKNLTPVKNNSVQKAPQTQPPQGTVKDIGTPRTEPRQVSEESLGGASKIDGKATGKRKPAASVDADDISAHDDLLVTDVDAAKEKKRKKKQKRRRREKRLKQEQDRSQHVENAEGDEDSVDTHSTAPETNDFHQVRDVQDNGNAHGTQQQEGTSSIKKSKHKHNKEHGEGANAPKSDGEFMKQLWGVLGRLESNTDITPYAPSDSDCIVDEQASTPRKDIRTITRKIKIETAAANKPSPQFICSTRAPPPSATLQASSSAAKSPPSASNICPARIDDDLGLVRFHFEAIQNHIAALRYLSRTRNMRQEQVQDGFRKLVRSIPQLPPPLFGRKKGSYEEVESAVKHEGLDRE